MKTFDENPFSVPRTCEQCGWDDAGVLFHFAGDPVSRCSYCHNNARIVGVSTTEDDWF